MTTTTTTAGVMRDVRQLQVHLTSAGWFVFRGSPLNFPVAGPYLSERDADEALRQIVLRPFGPLPT